MSKLKSILRHLRTIFFGPLHAAKKEGLKCGKNVTIMKGTDFGSEPYLITLGNDVRISDHVFFFTHDGGSFVFRRDGYYKGTVRFARIRIGNNCFIGSHALILPGVHIGDNCVIGAGSVVTNNFDDNSVIAGVPAKKICNINEYAERMKKRMPKELANGFKNKNKRIILESVLPD